MSICVIVFKEKQSAKDLILNLRETQTPILNCDLVKPLDNKNNSEKSNQLNSVEESPNEINFNNVKLLNPNLAKKDRQKALATWLVPFGFIAGLGFSQMTELKTFSEMGFPDQLEKLLGGLVGMISGWLGSFFSAGGINQDNLEDLRALRKKSEEGFWLLILETPLEIELPWSTIKEINDIEIIMIGKQ